MKDEQVRKVQSKEEKQKQDSDGLAVKAETRSTMKKVKYIDPVSRRAQVLQQKLLWICFVFVFK